jgi:DNA-binding CsgD family transcriptional regulator
MDYDGWEILSERMVALARRSGDLTVLPLGLTLRMGAHLHAGELAAVSSLHEEVSAINDATGTHLAPYSALLLFAWRGSEAEGAGLIEATLREVALRGEGQGVAVAQSAGAILYNGLGRYQEALAAARIASECRGELVFRNWGLAELVEAAVRCGDGAAATDALESLSQTTRPSGTDWALGVEARCRALLSRGETAEHLYREAIERLGRSRVRIALARAHLLYGEWLRQEDRRLDAREQLRTAYEMCTRIGLEASARRAERELQATGGRVRKRVVETREDLTAQEAQIARLARDGFSNPEIAARLFISPRTVEYHLHKVFSKPKISSRNELGRALQQEPTAALAV